MKTSTVAATALGLGAVALLVWGLWAASRPMPEALQGQMEARETDVAPKITARITAVPVREGQRIEAGALLMRTDSGAQFRIGSGLTDGQRAHPPAIGIRVTYRYNGLTVHGLPRFPRFLRIRDEP